MAKRRRCEGVTKKGERCRNAPLDGTALCIAHSPKITQEKAGFGGAQPGAGRPRLPRPHELLREKIEGDLERWLAPLEDALEAQRAVVVGSGESAEVELVPDHKIRLQAVRDAHDRVYGKPAQSLELGGPAGGPIEISATPDLSRLSVEEKRSLIELLDKADAGAER